MNRPAASVVSGVLLLTALTAGASIARAQANLTWSSDGATPGSGGTGIWDTTTAVWFDGTSFVPWTNSTFYNAIFSGTAGTVTLGVPISAQNLTFGANGYAITGSTLTLGSGSTPTIILAPGISATISSLVG